MVSTRTKKRTEERREEREKQEQSRVAEDKEGEEGQGQVAHMEEEDLLGRSKQDRAALEELCKRDGRGLESLLSSLSVTRLKELWCSWQLLAAEEAIALSSQEDKAGCSSSSPSASLLSALARLAGCSASLAAWKEGTAAEVPEGLRQTVALLHGLLPSKSVAYPLRCEISLACETWFVSGLPDRDAFVDNAIIFLLKRALDSKATRSDVRRVWQLHESLLGHRLPDLEKPLHHLLLAAAKSHHFVKSSEGIRFVVFLFSLSPSFVVPLHESIKESLPGCGRQVSCAYGEVYHKAWRTSSGDFRHRLEEDCLQDLMARSLVANRALPARLDVFQPCYHILERFHNAKNDHTVQSMCCRLWSPLLFRHLSAANPLVRRSAAEMLFSAFPLEDPNAHAEEKAARHDEQYRAMLRLLSDENPDVRAGAVAGVCRVLAVFWLVVPETFLARASSILLRDLAFDAASPKVRAAVLRGLRAMLSMCAQTHLFMKKSLPRVSDCLHDVSETVRLATLDLLAEVKRVRAIQYWEVCSLDSLLVRLEVDRAPVCGRIVRLLFNSFFPMTSAVAAGDSDHRDEVKIQRCVYLIKKNRNASRRFYEYGEKLLNLHDCVKFMLAILVRLKRFIQKEMRLTADDSVMHQSREEAEEEDKENHGSEGRRNGVRRTSTNLARKRGKGGGGDGKKRRKLYTESISEESAGGDALTVSTSANNNRTSNQSGAGGDDNDDDDDAVDADLRNPAVVSALLDVVCIFWVFRSREIAQEGNVEYRSLLEKKAAKILTLLFKFYRSSEVIGPVVYLCSLLPHASVSTVASFCLSRLRLTEVADVDVAETAGGLGDIDEVAPTYTNALCNWGRGDDLLDLIIGWIRKDCGKSLEATAEVAKTEPPRRKGRGVRFAEAAEEESGKPVLALLLVEYAMQHPVNRAILLRKNRAQLEELRSSLLAYVPIIRTHLRGEGACDKTGKKLAMVWKLALKLTVLLQEEGEADASCSETLGKIEDLMEWTEKEVLTEEGGSGSGNSTRLGVELSRSTVSVCCDMVTIGVCDINFIGHLLELCGMLLNKDPSLPTLSLVCQACHEVASWTSCRPGLARRARRRREARDDRDAGEITQEDAAVDVVHASAIPDMLAKILCSLGHLEIPDFLSQHREARQFRSRLAGLLDLYQKKLSRFSEGAFFVVLRTILDAVLAEMVQVVEKSLAVDSFESVQELPPASWLCLGAVAHSKSLMTALLEEWIAAMEDEEAAGEGRMMEAVAAWLTLLKLVRQHFGTKAARSGLKEIVKLAERRQEELEGAKEGENKDDSEAPDSSLLAERCREATKSIKANLGMLA